MESFASVLDSCIKSRNMSIAEFSRQSGQNKGELSAVLRGTRKLSEQKLINLLNTCFLGTPEEMQLRDAFYNELYGSESFSHIQYIKESLESLAKYETPNNTSYDDSVTFENQIESIASSHRILKTIRYILNSELQKDKPVIYTNYSFSCTEIDEIVYSFISESKKQVDFNHIVVFENSGQSLHNLRNIFSSIRFFKLRLNTLFYNADSGQIKNIDFFYPYFLATSSYVLLFNFDYTKALFISEANTVNSMAFSIQQICMKCTPLASFPKNEMELRQVVLQNSQRDFYGGFSYYPCFGKFADFDIYNQIANKDIPERENVIQILDSFYKALYQGSRTCTFHTIDGFKHFAETGRFHEPSEHLINKAPKKIRAILFDKMIEAKKKQSNVIYLLDEKRLTYPDDICLDFYENSLGFFGSISQGKDHFSGEFYLCINDRILVSDFKNFRDYVLRNGFFYNDDYTLHFLNDLKTQCQE